MKYISRFIIVLSVTIAIIFSLASNVMPVSATPIIVSAENLLTSGEIPPPPDPNHPHGGKPMPEGFDPKGERWSTTEITRLGVRNAVPEDARWADNFYLSGLAGGDVYAIAQDGTGGVYVGGSFTRVNGSRVNGIVRWNGSSWDNLNGGTDWHVTALDWDGPNNVLYVGGYFYSVGGGSVPAYHIAKWNPSSGEWSAMGSFQSNSNGYIYALAVDSSGNVYAGGEFTKIGGVTANNLAKWNGITWSPLGDGITNPGSYAYINTLTVDVGGNLYAGGWFTKAGNVTVSNLAQWNGTAWTGFGSDVVDNDIHTITILNSNVYIGGHFLNIGSNQYNYIAFWNGTSWAPLGTGVNRVVWSLTTDGTDVYAGGDFWSANPLPDLYTSNVAKWDVSEGSWSRLSDSSGYFEVYEGVYALSWSGSALYIGGGLNISGDKPAHLVSKFEGGTWTALGAENTTDKSLNRDVNAILVDGDNIYVGGNFRWVGTTPAFSIAKWNNFTESWSQVGTVDNSDTNGGITALAMDESGILYAGGWFTKIGGVDAQYIAKWNGSAWSALDSGVNSGVGALAFVNGSLYAGGWFTSPGNHIAKWDGSTWTNVGEGTDDTIRALAQDSNGNLYAGGVFTKAGDVTVNGIAKWNGTAWSALGTGVYPTDPPIVLAITFDRSGNLYAGGWFNKAGGVTVEQVAKWNGSAWSALGSGTSDGNTVNGLAADGNDIYAVGWKYSLGGQNINYIGRWNGSQWSALGSGLDSGAWTVKVGGGYLFMGGNFGGAGDKSSAYFARWAICGNPFPAPSSAPVAIAPSGIGPRPTILRWQPVNCASKYTVQVYQYNTDSFVFNEVITNQDAHCANNETQCWYQVPGSLLSGRHNFRVLAANTAGNSLVSRPLRFTMLPNTPGIPDIQVNGGSSSRPIFNWFPAENAARHQVQLKKNGRILFNRMVSSSICIGSPVTCSFPSPILLGSGTYSLTVRGSNASGWGIPDTQTFITP